MFSKKEILGFKSSIKKRELWLSFFGFTMMLVSMFIIRHNRQAGTIIGVTGLISCVTGMNIRARKLDNKQ